MVATDNPAGGNRSARALKRPRDPRSLARQLAMQFLYQLEVQGDRARGQMENFLQEYADDPQMHQLARTWIQGAWATRRNLDETIQAVSAHWDLTRINLVDRGNLRLAVYQLLNCPDIPPKVVINEAVELAKLFSTRQAPAFVNGILDAIRKKQPKRNSPTALTE